MSVLTGPFSARGGIVFNRFEEVVLVLSADSHEADAERVASDMNLADSLHAEPNVEKTLALHRRDAGDTIMASVEFCAAVFPDELRAAIAKGIDAAKLLGIRKAPVVQMGGR